MSKHAHLSMNIEENLTQENLNSLNPLVLYGDETINQSFVNPGTLLTRVLVFAFPLAGLILFVMLIWAGLEVLRGASKKSKDEGKKRAESALIGFMLLFASFFLIQVLEVVFGLSII